MDAKDIKKYDGMINILIATNKHNAGVLDEYFMSKSRARFNVVGTTDNGERAKKLIISKKPDVLILDFILYDCDGLGLLKYIYNSPEVEPKPKCVLLTAFTNEVVVKKAMDYGTKFFMPWPCDLDELNSRIAEMFLTQFDYLKPITPDEVWDDKIMELFKMCEMNVNMVGYKYFNDAVKIKLNAGAKLNMERDIYAVIADRYGVQAGTVDRAMRNAINAMWDRQGMATFNYFINKGIFSLKEKPTNQQFICALADLMKDRI